MSKAVSKAAHFLPRVGQFTLHAKRNGAMPNLPKKAKDPVYELLDRRKNLIRQLQNIEDEQSLAIDRARRLQNLHSHKISLPPEVKEAQAACAQLRHQRRGVEAELRKVNEIVLPQGENGSFHVAFVRAAELLLSNDTFLRLRNEAHRIVDQRPYRADGADQALDEISPDDYRPTVRRAAQRNPQTPLLTTKKYSSSSQIVSLGEQNNAIARRAAYMRASYEEALRSGSLSPEFEELAVATIAASHTLCILARIERAGFLPRRGLKEMLIQAETAMRKKAIESDKEEDLMCVTGSRAAENGTAPNKENNK
jgi:hypothetical protein